MNKSEKTKIGRPLTDYGDAVNNLVVSIKNKETVAPKLPDDMKKSGSQETLLALAHDIVAATRAAPERENRIRGKVLNSAKLSLKSSAGGHFGVIAIAHYIEKFETCFASIERGAYDRSSVLGAIEAAIEITALAPLARMKRHTAKARAKNIDKDRGLEAATAQAIRKVAAKKGIPLSALKAGKKFFDLHLRDGVIAEMGVSPDDLPKSRKLTAIVSRMKKESTSD